MPDTTTHLPSDSASRKGILLAGGSGTRLHPITISVNKHLLPVYDKPLIYYPLSVLMLAGVREILLISTPRDVPAFQELLGDGSRWGIEISYAVQAEPRGLPDAYLIGEEFLQEKPSAMMLGDNLLYGAGLGGLLQTASAHADGATLFAYKVADARRYGVLRLDRDMRPIGIEEKPENPPSSWAVTGLYFMDGEAPARARALRPSARGELEITDLLGSYLDAGCLHSEFLKRGVTWLDTGNPHALLQAGHFVEVLQERQGLRVACPEEIAFRLGYIDGDALLALARALNNGSYGQYLAQVVHEEREGRRE